ncbi:MAG TPA: hypothetical protein VLV15_12095 [Dongiaceae bacterium]|nr:hypothetical protein [Dongiaceae bacterium]
MKPRLSPLVRRITRSATGCLLGGALMVPLGGSVIPQMGPTSTSRAVDQINSAVTRPMTTPMPGTVVVQQPDPQQWIPDRWVQVPGAGVVMVPGHWERRLDAHKVFVPSITVQNPQTGVITTFPAGTYPPVDERLAP